MQDLCYVGLSSQQGVDAMFMVHLWKVSVDG